jgi:hypothetical protein
MRMAMEKKEETEVWEELHLPLNSEVLFMQMKAGVRKRQQDRKNGRSTPEESGSQGRSKQTRNELITYPKILENL